VESSKPGRAPRRRKRGAQGRHSSDKITLLTPETVDQVNKESSPWPLIPPNSRAWARLWSQWPVEGVGFAASSLLMALVPGLVQSNRGWTAGCCHSRTAGATIGAAAGNELENQPTEGLPEDEIFVYEDALRQGRSVVIVVADDKDSGLSAGLTKDAGPSRSTPPARMVDRFAQREESHYSSPARASQRRGVLPFSASSRR